MDLPTPEHVKIESLRIVLGGLAVNVSVQQAKALYDQLNDLFGKEPAAPVYIPYVLDHTNPWWHQPVYVDPNTEPFPDKWTVTHDSYLGSTLSINV